MLSWSPSSARPRRTRAHDMPIRLDTPQAARAHVTEAERLRQDLRNQRAECVHCQRPLEGATLLDTTWQVIRHGFHQGDRGLYALLRCGCARQIRWLWRVQVSPSRNGLR
jgi:hypothetical protein